MCYDAGKAQAVVYMLDSQDYGSKELKSLYGWVKFDQTAWYRRTSRALTEQNGGTPLPALLYMHIPLPEYWEIINSKEYIGNYLEGEVCSPTLILVYPPRYLR